MIAQGERDGVPVLLGPGTGPMRADLVFRVGFADEPLARHGITHLLEHLALHPLGLTDYHFNGSTGAEHTSFHVQGTPDDVAGFLTGVCAALNDLPVHRLDVEKALLQAEANSRGGGVLDAMPLWRHGALGHGITSYPEWGVPAITADELRAWAAHYFTRENAVLWIAGDHVPAGLALHLPAGRRVPSPEPSSVLPVIPAYFPGPPEAVGWSALVRRGPAAEVFADVLERAMFRTLRQEAGLSYTATTGYRPIGARDAMVVALADAVPDKQGAVLGGLVDVLAALRVGRVDPADLGVVQRQRCEALRQAGQDGGRLAGQAAALLGGTPVRQVEQEIADIMAVTAADVVAVAGAAGATGLLMAPEGSDGRWAGFTPAPSRSDSVVIGTAYVAHSGRDSYLVTAEDGVTLTSGDDHFTVRFDSCSIVRAWPDGARLFVGHDGIVVQVEPTLFRDGHQAVAFLDARLSYGLRVDQPPRDRIPSPEPLLPEPQTVPTKRERLERRNNRASYVVAGIFGVSLAVRGALTAENEFGTAGLALFLLLLLAVTVAAGRFVYSRR
jgi:zinc protease